MDKFVAYSAYDGEIETFETFEQAEVWLESYYEDGEYQCESMDGGDFIAAITHRSKFTVKDKKSNYSQQQINDGEWPYDYDEHGEMSIEHH